MSASTIRIIVAVVLIAHGIGHYMGMLSALGVKMSSTSSYNSWLLMNLFGETAARIIEFIIFLLAFLGFIGAGMSFLGWLIPQEWWQSLAISSAIISLLCLILFLNAFAFFFNKVGAFGVNIAVLICLLGLHWPTEVLKH